MGDDERTESEDNRRISLHATTAPIETKSNRFSYIAGSGAIPPIPMSPSGSNTASPKSPRGAPPPPPGTSFSPPARVPTFELASPTNAPPPVPTHGRSLSRTDSFEPSSPAPQVPPHVPSHGRSHSHVDSFEPTSPAPKVPPPEATGYEADEDTDMNNTNISVDEDIYASPSGHRSGIMRTPSQRAPPPPPPSAAAPVSPVRFERAPPPPVPSAPVPPSHGHEVSIPEDSEPAAVTHAQSPPVPGLSRSLTGGSMTQRYSRASLEHAGSSVRRSMEQSNTGGSFTHSGLNKRLSMDVTGSSITNQGEADHTHAVEFDLQPETQWWLKPNGVPASVTARKDVLYETDDSELYKRGGRVYSVRDVYVLFTDYSQTIITVEFSKVPGGYVSFQQRIEPAPAQLRQDQLEAVYATFGRKIGDNLQQFVGASLATGNFVPTLLSKTKGHLDPVGGRSYGALVYHNLANASVRQHDEIRRGDVAVFRGSKFQGHKGSLHTKYQAEAGRQDNVHVGIVYEWDGAKRKIRVYEQPENGAAGGKVKAESYRLNDLKSGEVKVFRVVGRDYVGWD